MFYPPPVQFQVCAQQASKRYRVPLELIESILHQESGKVGMTVPDPNGTYDIGPMQVNSCWLPTLARYGITQRMIQWDACMNIEVGTWILARNLRYYGVPPSTTHYLSHAKQLDMAIMAYNIGTHWNPITEVIGNRYARSVLTYWNWLYRYSLKNIRYSPQS
jgi:soluble lytic murein transglycosylase-like protein